MYKGVKGISKNQHISRVAFVFLILHPVVFEPNRFSSDGLLASSMVLATALILSGPWPERSRWSGLIGGSAGILLYVVTLGTKEVGLVWGAVLLSFIGYLLVFKKRRSVKLLTVFLGGIVVSILWALPIHDVKQVRYGASPAIEAIGETFFRNMEYITPFPAFVSMITILVALVGLCFFTTVRLKVE